MSKSDQNLKIFISEKFENNKINEISDTNSRSFYKTLDMGIWMGRWTGI